MTIIVIKSHKITRILKVIACKLTECWQASSGSLTVTGLADHLMLFYSNSRLGHRGLANLEWHLV